MKSRYYLAILLCLMLSSCIEQVQKIKRAKEVVEQAKENIKTSQYQAALNELANADISIANLTKEIDASNVSELISSKDEIIKICSKLNDLISNSTQLLETRHGTDENGNLKNSTERKYVNQIFIEDGKALQIKSAMNNTIDQFMLISNKHDLNINEDSLPIKSMLDMNAKGETWEHHLFHDMPAVALLPILQKLINDLKLTKLLLLEELAGMKE